MFCTLDALQVKETERSFTRSVSEGMGIYRKLREEERLKEVKPGWFGGEVNKRRASVMGDDNFRTMAQAAPKRKHSKLRDQTLVQLQLQASILDLGRVSYVLYGVKYIGLVSLWASILGYMRDLSFLLYHLCGSGCNRILAQ